MMKKIFRVDTQYTDEWCPVIAETPTEAKTFAHGYFEGDVEWIDLRCRLMKIKVEVSDRPKGVIRDVRQGLKDGVFGYVENEDCPRCKSSNTTLFYDGEFFCSSCDDGPHTKSRNKDCEGEQGNNRHEVKK